MFLGLRSLRNIIGNNVSATMCPRLPGPLRKKCLQSNQVKPTPLDYINEWIIWKLNQLIAPLEWPVGLMFKRESLREFYYFIANIL